MSERDALLPRRALILCCIPVQRAALPNTGKCGICKEAYHVPAAWLDEHALDASPPPPSIVCPPCYSKFSVERFRCRKCGKSQPRYTWVDAPPTLEHCVRKGSFFRRHEKRKMCSMCKQKKEEDCSIM